VANRITTVLDLDGKGWKSGLAEIKRSIGDAEGAVGKLKAGWGGVMSAFASSPVAIGAAGAAVGAFAAKAVGDASALEESINAVNVAYGKSAEGVHALGEQSAESFGLSQRAFNEFSVQFSAFAEDIANQSGRDVVDVLAEMTTRTADFASVNNLEMSEAARIMQSSLAGETEALRRYGGDVSAAAVETFALENGLIKTKGELTESIKVQARYGLLMRETAKTSGDFANTSESLANQQRILSANVEDLSASFGSKLIPVVSDAAQIVNNLISVYDELTGKAGGGGGGFSFGDAFKGADAKGLGGFIKGLQDAADATEWLNKKVDGNEERVTDQIARLANAREAAEGWTSAHVKAAEAVDYTSEASDRYVESLVHMADETKAAQAAAEAKAVADEKAAAAADKHRESVEAVAEAMEDQRSAALDLVGGDIAVRDAQRRAAEAAEELTDNLDDQGAALDEAADAQLNAASAAAEYRAKQMEANGQTVDARVKAQLMKEELQALVGQLDGPLAAAIQNYINQLGAIPQTVGTTIVLNKPGRVGDFDVFARTNAPRAAGGPTYPGLHRVLERGPELLQQGGQTFLMSNGGGNVVPLGAGAGMSGGGVWNITLNVAQAISPVEAINLAKQYERFNGTNWRT
jgi:hypothetical protein